MIVAAKLHMVQIGRPLLSDRFAAEFRLFDDFLANTFAEEVDDPDWGKANRESSSLNILRVKKYLNNSKMKELARDNMPFMALEIHGLAESR